MTSRFYSFLLAAVLLPAVLLAQPSMETDPRSIWKDGSTGHIPTALIPFPFGLSVPDNIAIQVGDTAGFFVDGYGYIQLTDPNDGSPRVLQFGTSNVTDGPAPGGSFTAGSAAPSGTDGGDFQVQAGAAGTGRGGIINLLGGTRLSGNAGFVRVGVIGTPNKFSLTSNNATSSLYINQALEIDGITYGDGGILVGSTIFDANTSTSSVGVGQAGSSGSTLGITSALAGSSQQALNIAHTVGASTGVTTNSLNITSTVNYGSSSGLNSAYRALNIDVTDSSVLSSGSGFTTDNRLGLRQTYTRTGSNNSGTASLYGLFFSGSDAATYNMTSGNQNISAYGFQAQMAAAPTYNDGGNGRTLTYSSIGSNVQATFGPTITAGTVVSTVKGVNVQTVTGSTAANNTSTIYGIDVAGPTNAATSYGQRIGAASATTTAYGLAIANPITATTKYQVALNGADTTGSGLFFNTPTRAGLEYIRSGATGILNLGAGTSIKLDPLTSNGFVKTSGGDGTLSVDTTAYISLASLSGVSPISYDSGTGAISFLFNTNNTWTGTNLFNNTLTVGSAGAGHDVIFYGDDAGTKLEWIDTATTVGLDIIGSGSTAYPYDLNVRSQGATSYIGICNNFGTTGCAFFGIETNDFSLYNWQGSGMNFYTGTSAGAASNRLIIEGDGDITIVDATAQLYFRGGTNNYLDSPAAGSMRLNASTTAIMAVGATAQLSITSGTATFAGNIDVSKTTPTVFLTDAAGDDWSIAITSGAFAILNRTDNVNILSATNASTVTLDSVTSTTFQIGKATEMTLTADTLTFENGASDTSLGWASSGVLAITATSLTNSGTLTSSGNITISKATPLLQFTDSGGDDYSIDVGAAAASRFRIRNTTDATTVFDVDGSNRIAFSTNYAPQSAYKVYIQDRSTAANPGANLAALNSTFEYLPSATTTTQGNNLHGYEGGISVYASNGSISGGGAFFGLRGGASVFFGAGTTNSNNVSALFASLSASQLSGTGGTQNQASVIGTFASVGADTTITDLAFLRITGASVSGAITTQYGIKIDAMTGGSANYEGWMGTDAGWFFREAGNQINSRAAATLDIDATTTLNNRIGGTIELVLTATQLDLMSAASDRVNFIGGSDGGAPSLLGKVPSFADAYGAETAALGEPDGWLEVKINGALKVIPYYEPAP